MEIFGKNYTTTGEKNSTTIIGKDTTIKGRIETEGSIFVDGRFEGAISSNGVITIGSNGIVVGNIKAQVIHVSGKLDGIVEVENINILSSGHVLGQLTYSRMNVEGHGFFDGESRKKNSSIESEYTKLGLHKDEALSLHSIKPESLPDS